MSLIITDAGIAAAIRAGDLGIEYKITHISIGSEGYVPEPAQTELRNELQKKAITRGALVAHGQLHFETVWDGVEEFEGKELGYWLEDGTLFAVDSRDGDIITYKRKNTVVTEACELNLSASTISNITVELLGSPYATETVAGIAKITTTNQVNTGTDDATIVTPKKLKDNAATNSEIDAESTADKHVRLSQLWRAITPSRLIDKLWLGLAAKIFPVGAAIPWFTDVAPSGFAIMKGQAFNKATYPELAKVFTSGAIPDMRGCGAIGKYDGEGIGVYEEGQVKNHSHPNSSVTSTDLGSKTSTAEGGHYHWVQGDGGGGASTGLAGTSGGGNHYGRNTSSVGNHVHYVGIGAHAHSVAIAWFGASRNTINHRKVNWIVRLA
ncbi:tail fiber protein [Vibrio plantisponsor]|uniref:Tail fiber protein n=1 Tax=Vibrio plantisponsor TaxID=664643 RepID=A0ABU4IND5_9VIBR|nr:phage tail protein [Vibrio plantisponsor]MDW6019930.1 tail fiber protein [Vibrio plantisponsor]NNM38741.1 phage tail protein [Vibrio plantisponsor]